MHKRSALIFLGASVVGAHTHVSSEPREPWRRLPRRGALEQSKANAFNNGCGEPRRKGAGAHTSKHRGGTTCTAPPPNTNVAYAQIVGHLLQQILDMEQHAASRRVCSSPAARHTHHTSSRTAESETESGKHGTVAAELRLGRVSPACCWHAAAIAPPTTNSTPTAPARVRIEALASDPPPGKGHANQQKRGGGGRGRTAPCCGSRGKRCSGCTCFARRCGAFHRPAASPAERAPSLPPPLAPVPRKQSASQTQR